MTKAKITILVIGKYKFTINKKIVTMWVKASIQLPDKKGTYNTRSDSEMVYLQRFFHNDGMPFMSQPVDMEWLDESSSTAPRLQEAAEWVRVEDRLPDEDEDVLGVHVEAGGIQIVWYDHEEKRWETIDLDPLHTLLITHWRPLPAPPKPNNE